jgi:hypothetical protein
VRYNLKESKNWETSFGIGGMQQSNTNKGLEALFQIIISLILELLFTLRKNLMINLH